jgi:hypothetical protein
MRSWIVRNWWLAVLIFAILGGDVAWAMARMFPAPPQQRAVMDGFLRAAGGIIVWLMLAVYTFGRRS